MLLLTGGARSGKSRLAVRVAATTGRPVHTVVTAVAEDDEMRRRIAAHRRERPAAWRTVEAPVDLGAAVTGAPTADCLVVDCLSLWVSNLLAAASDGTANGTAAIEQRAARVAQILAARSGPTIVVTNEVGLGLVPMHPVGRAYRDLLGRVNASFAAVADDVHLVVAGRTVRLHPVSDAGTLLDAREPGPPVSPPG